MILQALPVARASALAPPARDGSNAPAVVRLPGRAVMFSAGVVSAGIGIAALLRADLGTGPGDVMIGAMATQIGVSHGTAAQATGAAFILVAMMLGRRPGPGTIATALFLGPIINLALATMPFPGSPATRTLLAVTGLATMGVGVGLSIGARFGPSTAELWSDAVSAHLRASKQSVRLYLEATLVALGFVLGGPVGILTLVTAVTIGPLIDLGVLLAHRITGASMRGWERSTHRLSRL